jgi:hypothetical protein
LSIFSQTTTRWFMKNSLTPNWTTTSWWP